MAQAGVIVDAHTIVIISRIHQMNGQRDELKKFKDHIDQVSVALLHHYRQFYDSLKRPPEALPRANWISRSQGRVENTDIT
ncbi:hypothetical protein ACSBR2_037601 [Camellia fascicularis]